MTACGARLRTFATKSATVFAPCTVAVGLFGLLKKTSPAPGDASIIGWMSSRKFASTLISLRPCLSFFAVFVQFSNVGAAVTR